MNDVLEGAVCGVDGCTPAALDHVDPASGAKATLAIEVISDAICPWCWVANSGRGSVPRRSTRRSPTRDGGTG
jgi:hypothetical protein